MEILYFAIYWTIGAGIMIAAALGDEGLPWMHGDGRITLADVMIGAMFALCWPIFVAVIGGIALGIYSDKFVIYRKKNKEK